MSDTKKQQNFLQGTALLALATAIVKVIGALYKIPLNAIIGEQGFGFFFHGQVQPTQEIIAGAVALSQSLMCGKHFLLGSQQIGQRELSPHIGNIDFNHIRRFHPLNIFG